ncbi:MAG TPA: MDR family MFS transporter [Candidatus Limnocylindrales bacterium]|nr:MDR family MFS transporter [Candidatus Limnocylindrales bacterium]
MSQSRAQVVLATLGVAMALLLSALDQTVVGVAMPRIVADLQGLNFYAWVTTAYLVTSTLLVPVAGKLGDMFGRKPFLLAGMVGFIGASALCGTSQNMIELVLFRALQGVFAGVLFASTFAVLADVFPPTQRARMTGLFGAVFGLSSLIGPTLGGYLTDGPGWRWVFYVNVPLGVAAVALVATQLPFVRSSARLRDIDWIGTGLLFGGLTPLLIALSMTRDHSWTSVEVLGLLAVAAVMLVAFYFVERKADHPVVPFHLFRLNVFAVPAAISFFSGVGMFGAVIFVPLLYQGVLHVSATNSGQLLTPMMLAVVVSATVTGAVIARIPAYRFLGAAALAAMIAGLALLTRVGVGASPLEVTRDIIIIGAGLGVTFPLTLVVVQAGLPHQLIGVATSQITFWRSLGGTIGTAVLGSILTNRLSVPPTPVGLANALHEVFLVAAIVAAVSVVASLALREVPLTQQVQRLPDDAEVAA